MVQLNFGLKEISAKIVYYGPGMCGKTTNLEKVHALAPKDRRGSMTAVATEGDRTLFFDFMPLDLGTVAGMKLKFQLYTVPGQIYYDATRKLVLQGADGVIFVADSHPDKIKENVESLDNLAVNLKVNGVDIETIPLVIQYNKRDLPNAMPVADMDRHLKRYPKAAYTQAAAFKGEGVMETLKSLARIVIADIDSKYGAKSRAGGSIAPTAFAAEAPAPAAPKPVVAPPVIAQPMVAQAPKPVIVAPPAPTIAQPPPAQAPPRPAQVAASTQPPAAPPKPAVESNVKMVEKKKGFFSRLFGG